MKIAKCGFGDCSSKNTEKCQKCKNNTLRNYVKDYFQDAQDKDASKLESKNGRFKAQMIGTAEQGGYKCPACGRLTSPYSFSSEKICEECGLALDV